MSQSVPNNIETSNTEPHVGEGALAAPLHEHQPPSALSRADILYQRLNQRDVTLDEVREWCYITHKPGNGQHQQNLMTFVQEGDLEAFWWLYDWWSPVASKPTTLPTPAIQHFCWFSLTADGQPEVSFLEAVKKFHTRAVAHCREADLNVVTPGESAEERKRRRNAERMAKARAHRRVPSKVAEELPTEQREQLANLENSIAALKAEAKSADNDIGAEVSKHYQAMLIAADIRKRTAAGYKERIDAMVELVKQLTAKQ